MIIKSTSMKIMETRFTSVPLLDWIKSASTISESSNDDYLKSAINVALMLTASLNEGVGTNVQEIIAEKVTVFVPHRITHQNFLDIKSVAVQSGLNFSSQNIQQQEICHALGKILLTLFSRGRDQGQTFSANFDANQDFGSALDLNATDTSNKRRNRAGGGETKRAGSQTTMKMSIQASDFLCDLGAPQSVCRLVADLLDASGDSNTFRSDFAYKSLSQVQLDLNQMKCNPEKFLYDQTDPQQALEMTGLFQHSDEPDLFGREKETSLLMKLRDKVTLQCNGSNQQTPAGLYTQVCSRISCEAAFLAGRSGSGKSCLLDLAVKKCIEKDWLTVRCKFARHLSPIMAIFQSVDDFLGNLAQFMPRWRDVALSIVGFIVSSSDDSVLMELCNILPNLVPLLPLVGKDPNMYRSSTPVQSQIDAIHNQMSSGWVGSGRNRLHYLFHIIVSSLCQRGRVLLVFDDLQWANESAIEMLLNSIEALVGIPITPGVDGSFQGSGLFVLGSFRDNEVQSNGALMNGINHLMTKSHLGVNVSLIPLSELSVYDISKMLSSKLCLPVRLTEQLAQQVYQKTRGSPLFIVEFLKTLILDKTISFSVLSRRWEWDDEVVDLHAISDGVAQLLKERLHRLPSFLVETLKIASCIGSQVEQAEMSALSGHFPFDLLEALSLAVKEGLMEKAASVYAFSHDSLQEACFDLIPVDSRKSYHKLIGLGIVQSSDTLSSSRIRLAVKQINRCKDDDVLSLFERELFAKFNLKAGKDAMNASCFSEGHNFFEAGISLLSNDHWQEQYDLSLELYEMSVTASFADGHVDDVPRRLHSILSNAKSFLDTLNASALHVRSMWSSGMGEEAINNCVVVLSGLGETFPSEIQQSDIMNELNDVRPLLEGITRDNILRLSKMTDSVKLNAMRFGALICKYGAALNPMLSCLVACRMVKLTLQFGMCDDSVVGLAIIGIGFIRIADEIEFGYSIAKLAENLISTTKSQRALRSLLGFAFDVCVKHYVEPLQSTICNMLETYDSAMSVGDIESAMIMFYNFCGCSVFNGMPLESTEKSLLSFHYKLTAHEQHFLLYNWMAIVRTSNSLTGSDLINSLNKETSIKTYSELRSMALEEKNPYLLYQVNIANMCDGCYFRRYQEVSELSELFQPVDSKRSLEYLRVFYEGLATLWLARATKEEKYFARGAKCIKKMTKFAQFCKWNYESKLFLLQAEMHTANDELVNAEKLYKKSIDSARRHKHINEEALSFELFGVVLVECAQVDRAMGILQFSVDKYTEWGAMAKVDYVKSFMEFYDPVILRKYRLIK